MFKLESKASLNGACATSVSGDYNTIHKNGGFNTRLPPLLETPHCWKTIYHLLELYGTMPETKTVQRSSMPADVGKKSGPQFGYSRQETRVEDDEITNAPTPLPHHREIFGRVLWRNLFQWYILKAFQITDSISQERTRLIVFGVAKIHKTRLLATLSGLKLEAEITTLNSSATWRKKARPVSLECSLTGQVGRAMIVLLEGVAPSQQ